MTDLEQELRELAAAIDEGTSNKLDSREFPELLLRAADAFAQLKQLMQGNRMVHVYDLEHIIK